MLDCFANSNGKCNCLKPRKCSGPCSFYKTHEQLRVEREKVAKRLNSLPEKQRESIRARYYPGGSWEER